MLLLNPPEQKRNPVLRTQLTTPIHTTGAGELGSLLANCLTSPRHAVQISKCKMQGRLRLALCSIRLRRIFHAINGFVGDMVAAD
jgi:hypothetical protein